MGLIRLLLAIAVLVAHGEQILYFKFPQGSTAVKVFFMISGFYMTLILTKKYLKLDNGYRLFITNRFLRLYPIYWIVLLVTLLVSVVGYFGFNEAYLLKPYLQQSEHLNPLSWSALVVSNLIIFFQSAVCFVDFHNGGIFLTGTHQGAVPGWHFLFVPQAWSIGLELTFYAAAPFFVGRSLRFVLLLAALCVGVRLIFLFNGLTGDPWDHRFFTNGFVYFVCGALSYKIYEQYLKKFYSKGLAMGMLVAWVAMTLFNLYVPDPFVTGYWIFFVQSFVSLPFVFELSKNWTWDRFIGEFSYPVYLGHYLFIALVEFVFVRYGWHVAWMGEVTLALTMAFSLVLLRYVSFPIDRVREERVVRSRNKQDTAAQTDALNRRIAEKGELKGVTNADKQV